MSYRSALVTIFLFCNVAYADQVRVRLLRFPLPLQISGSGLSVGRADVKSFQKISIPNSDVFSIDQKILDSRHRLWIVTKNNSVTRISDTFIEIRSFSGSVNILGYQFPSPLLLSTRQSHHTVDIIASLDFNKYLENVLMSEMPTQWPLEALKAQAVATRSYALYQMQARQNEPYQLDADNSDQVFAFHGESSQRDRIRQAVKETDGKVLTILGHVAKAFFHSDCGGQTEESREVWGHESAVDASLGTALDRHCPFNPGSIGL